MYARICKLSFATIDFMTFMSPLAGYQGSIIVLSCCADVLKQLRINLCYIESSSTRLEGDHQSSTMVASISALFMKRMCIAPEKRRGQPTPRKWQTQKNIWRIAPRASTPHVKCVHIRRYFWKHESTIWKCYPRSSQT